MSGGGGGGGCFVSSTPIWTPRGMIPISEIKKNDKVFTMNVETGEIETGTVMEVFSTIRPGLVKVETEDNSVVCSENHCYCTEDNEFREISGISSKVREENSNMFSFGSNWRKIGG